MSNESFQLLRALVFLGALAVGLGLERAAPHARLHPAWKTNLGLWAIDGALVGIICGACACAVARWGTEHGWGLLAHLEAPPLLAILGTVFVLDGISYAWHRANHQVPFLWRFHRVHHGDRDFHVSTALRFHPGELLLSLPIRLAAILSLGAPALGVLTFEAIFTCANILEHGNFNLPQRLERALCKLLVTPALHRWHHSRVVRHLNSNFGTVLTLWDRTFGTLQVSDSGRRVPTGLPGTDETASLAGALAAPFRVDAPPPPAFP